MAFREYEKEEGPSPRYSISKDLSRLTLMFITSAIIYFLIAGSLAIVMRIIQSDFQILQGETQNTGLFYASLTIHGQLMFFGFASMLTVGISYYLLSKFAKKPLYSMNLAIVSFALLNSGSIFLVISGIMFFGAGWYNLMPLTFVPGPGPGWSNLSAIIFLIADAMIGAGLTIFCINTIATVLRGKIGSGLQKTEQDNSVYDSNDTIREWQQERNGFSNKKNDNVEEDKHKSKSDEESDRGRSDFLTPQYLVPPIRWISLLGISSWFPHKYRQVTPAVSIVVVGIFVNALAQLIGNMGLFVQLSTGLMFVMDPNFEPNWLFTKDVWWFFGHPIVYFTLFSFLGATYYYIPRYSKKTVPYDKWAYRPWPFYFIFTVMVFSHHLFLDMPNPVWLQMIAQTASFGIVFPSGLTIMTMLMYIFRSRIKWNITAMFLVSGIAGWMVGGFTGVQEGWWGTNIYLHNTTHIVGHIHLILLMGSVLLALGLVYAIIPDITKKNTNKELRFIHLILTLIGGFGLGFLFLFLGYDGFIRRVATVPEELFGWSMQWLLFFALIVGVGQLLFAFNILSTVVSRKSDERERKDSLVESHKI